MPNTLLDNLNSDFMAAFSALQPKNTPRRVLVYVEGYDDVAFWRFVLGRYENKHLAFDIHLPQQKHLEKGKAAVLKMADKTGEYLILCVDSDYDYLLQGVTFTSKLLNENRFIFQTYVYSIENFICEHKSLHSICTQATKNDRKIIDLELLVGVYAGTIYPLLLWSVLFYKK